MAFRSPLLGFSDFFDEVGAVKAPVKKPVAKQPAKPGAPAPAPAPKPSNAPPQQTSSLPQKNVKLKSFGNAKQSTVTKKHAQVLDKAKRTLLKAAHRLDSAKSALAKKPASPAAVAKAASAMKTAATHASAAKSASVQAVRTPTPAAKRAATVARGVAAKAILGATVATVQAKKPVAPVVTKNLSPKAKAAVEKHNKAVVAQKKAAQELAQHTLKAKKSVQALAKAAVNQKKVSKALRTKGSVKAHVGTRLFQVGSEEVMEALGEYYEAVGASPDPTNPGYLDDGSPDPAYAPVATDPSSGDPLISDSDISALTNDAEDPLDNINAAQGLPAMPLDQPTEPDYKLVGGILYNEAKGRPNGFCGSYGLMTRKTSSDAPGVAISGSDPGVNDYGYVWGSFDQDQIPNGTPWGGNLSENTWNELYGRFVRFMPGEYNHPVSESEAFASNKKTAPNGVSYGPLIGNPGMPDFKGMRVDAQGNMFWYPQEAPDWLTAPLKQAAALTEAKQKKAEEDAEKQYQLEQQKQQRDAQAAQAAQDAANALAESQAASDARVAEQQSQAQQAAEAATQAQQETQAQGQAQQALIEQQQQETQQAAAEAAQEQQAQQILVQRAQRQEQLMQQNPDIELALLAQQAGLLEDDGSGEEAATEGGDEGGDEGGEPSYEDTTAYSEPEAEGDKFRHPSQDDDYEASGLEDDGGFDDSGDDLNF